MPVTDTTQSSASTSKQPIQLSIESQVSASYKLHFMWRLRLIDLIYHLIKINCKIYRTFVVKSAVLSRSTNCSDLIIIVEWNILSTISYCIECAPSGFIAPPPTLNSWIRHWLFFINSYRKSAKSGKVRTSACLSILQCWYVGPGPLWKADPGLHYGPPDAEAELEFCCWDFEIMKGMLYWCTVYIVLHFINSFGTAVAAMDFKIPVFANPGVDGIGISRTLLIPGSRDYLLNLVIESRDCSSLFKN